MATYAIGDIQGCDREFEALLEHIGFGATDQLWLVGDLVNRGNQSAEVLERVVSMGDQVRMVLGNHDLHLLAIYFGGHNPSRSDTFTDVLAHRRMDEFANYLCQQPLLHHDAALGWTMTHAGIPHIWQHNQAMALADEVGQVLKGQHAEVSRQHFFEHMYGNEPDCWDDNLQGLPRVKLITNYFTRMRLLRADGTLNFSHKGSLSTAPEGWLPWYELAEYSYHLVFGHWAALDGMNINRHLHAIDTGCVYGRTLTALRLHDGVRFQVSAQAAYQV